MLRQRLFYIVMSKRITARQSAYKLIWEDLISLKIEPNERINVEELKRRYSMGVAPIREALSQLIETRMVTFIANKGYRCTPISIADMNNIYLCRSALIPIIIRECMKCGGDQWKSKVIASFYIYSKLLEKRPEAASDEFLFKYIRTYHSTREAVHYPLRDSMLHHIVSELNDAADRYNFLSLKNEDNFSEHIDNLKKKHDQFSEAIINGDADGAIAIALGIFDRSQKKLISLSESGILT